MIVGMTGSGKTAWVRSLLLQASETIYPPPESIVWCYSQWQPAYLQMLVTMPNIEFVKGILTALEQDSYFDVNKRSSIVFDDQMIDASKDKPICEPLYSWFLSSQSERDLYRAESISSGER